METVIHQLLHDFLPKLGHSALFSAKAAQSIILLPEFMETYSSAELPQSEDFSSKQVLGKSW
jgi:hypothetical protein